MRALKPLVALALSASIFCAWADALQDGIAAMNRKDYPAAIRALEPLATGGNPVAQFRLGLLHFHGHGVRESDEMAFKWFERAARQGLADAQFHLGNMYAYGLAQPPQGNDAARLAAQWYFEAARQGHAEAQYSLGVLFVTGTGVVQSREQARSWFRRAAAQGHADANTYLQIEGK